MRYRSHLSIWPHVLIALASFVIAWASYAAGDTRAQVAFAVTAVAVLYCLLSPRQGIRLETHRVVSQGLLIHTSMRYEEIKRIDYAPYAPPYLWYATVPFFSQLVVVSHDDKELELNKFGAKSHRLREIRSKLLKLACLEDNESSSGGRHRKK